MDAGLPPIHSDAPVEGKTDRQGAAHAVEVVPDVASSGAGIVLNAGSSPRSVDFEC